MFNLIQNAVKYNSVEGDLIIVIALDNQNDSIKNKKKNKINIKPNCDLIVEVIDTGLGIEQNR